MEDKASIIINVPINSHIIVLDQEDEAKIIWATEGANYWSALIDIKDALRQKVKYGDPDKQFSAEYLQSRFFHILESNHVDLDKIK